MTVHPGASRALRSATEGPRSAGIRPRPLIASERMLRARLAAHTPAGHVNPTPPPPQLPVARPSSTGSSERSTPRAYCLSLNGPVGPPMPARPTSPGSPWSPQRLAASGARCRNGTLHRTTARLTDGPARSNPGQTLGRTRVEPRGPHARWRLPPIGLPPRSRDERRNPAHGHDR